MIHLSAGNTPQRKSTLKRSVVRRVPSKTYEYGNIYFVACMNKFEFNLDKEVSFGDENIAICLGGSRKIGSPAPLFDSPGQKEEEE